LITDRGQTIRIRVDEIRSTGRNAQGVKLMSVEDDERLVAAEPIGESNVPDGNSLLPEGPDEDGAAGDVTAEDAAPTDSDETTNGNSSGNGEPEES
jgi:DNA gyrase subunit A